MYSVGTLVVSLTPVFATGTLIKLNHKYVWKSGGGIGDIQNMIKLIVKRNENLLTMNGLLIIKGNIIALRPTIRCKQLNLQGVFWFVYLVCYTFYTTSN